MKSKLNLNKKIDDIYKEVGEFGPYQLVLFCLIGVTAFIPALVGYSFSFYAAIPDFRCRLPDLYNDTYAIQNEQHQLLVNKYIPQDKSDGFKSKYDKCNLYNYSDTGNATKSKCNKWVYSKQYFEDTLISDVIILKI